MSWLSSTRNRVNQKCEGFDAFDVIIRTAAFGALAVTSFKLGKYVHKHGFKKALMGGAMAALQTLPGSASVVAAEKAKTLKKLEQMMLSGETASSERTVALPAKGMDGAKLFATLQQWSQSETKKWSDGQLSGGIYHGGTALLKLCTDVYALFALSNPLHPEVFMFVRKMEAEVVAMCLNLFHGKIEQAGGAMTSGGTESILMAMKAYRDRAYSKGIEEPEMIIPVTAHAAFDKAAHYFRIKLHKVPVDPETFRADVKQIAKLINRNTCAIVGSAPCFPQGIIDPIEELGQLAVKHDIGLHVDCCLGSFLVCYLERLGYNPPLFDFRVPGVSSISCDTHKYGFAPKGSSVVMFSNNELRQFMYFVAADWTGGIYASPTMPGSRPGGLIASTWAAMVHLGDEGYLNINRQIMAAARSFEQGIRSSIPELSICGKPSMSIVAFRAAANSSLNIFKVGEALTKRHWNLNTLQKPASLHICFTNMHINVVDRLLADVKAAVADVLANPNSYKDGSAAIYGMAEALPDNSLVEDMAKGFIDCLYKA